MERKREVISSKASCQEIRCQAWSDCAGTDGFVPPGPLGPTLRIGYSTRSGEYTRSRYFATLAHKNPRVTGCSGSPWILVARPSCTVIKTPQASGQSCGQAAWTTFFILGIIVSIHHRVTETRESQTAKVGLKKVSAAIAA